MCQLLIADHRRCKGALTKKIKRQHATSEERNVLQRVLTWLSHDQYVEFWRFKVMTKKLGYYSECTPPDENPDYAYVADRMQ
jgi:hypothetical protein